MTLFKAFLLAGIVLATSAGAETFQPFHSGVNLSVAPGGANSSSLPVATLQVENAQRVGEAAEIGFDFVRLRVALAPWTDTGSTPDQQKALSLANGIIQQALSNGIQIDVVMMAGSLSATTAAGLVCTADPSAVAACVALFALCAPTCSGHAGSSQNPSLLCEPGRGDWTRTARCGLAPRTTPRPARRPSSS
jgi:hypothetical protein